MFRAIALIVCGLGCLSFTAGCDHGQDSYRPLETGSSTPVSDTSVSAVEPVLPSDAPAKVSVRPATALPASATLNVSLSAGLALAQTLPDGTAMGFSIDYQFDQGEPSSVGRYIWVIVPTVGKPESISVELESSGWLQALFPGLKPEHGPFRCYLAQAGTGTQPQPISAVADLR